jgi:hypothetical protein
VRLSRCGARCSWVIILGNLRAAAYDRAVPWRPFTYADDMIKAPCGKCGAQPGEPCNAPTFLARWERLGRSQAGLDEGRTCHAARIDHALRTYRREISAGE